MYFIYTIQLSPPVQIYSARVHAIRRLTDRSFFPLPLESVASFTKNSQFEKYFFFLNFQQCNIVYFISARVFFWQFDLHRRLIFTLSKSLNQSEFRDGAAKWKAATMGREQITLSYSFPEFFLGDHHGYIYVNFP
jgi:hypothetical protein